MKKSVAFLKIAIKYKMDMSIHKTKCQNYYPVPDCCDKDSVHSIGEILIIHEEGINGIAVCTEVPAVFYWITLSLGEKCIEGEVRFKLSEQVIIHILHHQFQRLLWLLCQRR